MHQDFGGDIELLNPQQHEERGPNIRCDAKCHNQDFPNVTRSIGRNFCPDCYEFYFEGEFEILPISSSKFKPSHVVEEIDEILPNFYCDVVNCPNQIYSHVIRSWKTGINCCPDCYDFYFDGQFELLSISSSTVRSQPLHVDFNEEKEENEEKIEEKIEEKNEENEEKMEEKIDEKIGQNNKREENEEKEEEDYFCFVKEDLRSELDSVCCS